MAQSKTGTYVGCGIAVVAIVALVVGAIVLNNSRNEDQSSSDNGSETGYVDDSTPTSGSLTASDLQQVSESIVFGDYDGMETLSKKIQNGEMVGEVVYIDGLVSHPGTMYSVVQENPEGTQKIGTRFVIEGLDESSYPEDGVHVIITGKVVELEPLNYAIKTLPGFIEVDDGGMIVDDAEDTREVDEE